MTISFSYFQRTPNGVAPVSAEVLQHPLLLDSGEKHPTLTMADYFESLKHFVLTHRDSLPLLAENLSLPAHCKISSQKLGAFYHVAKVELRTGGDRTCLAVDTAISETGKQCLAADHQLLSSTLPAAMRPFVPKVFLYTGSEGKREAAAFHHLAAEWLENFHEWHLCGTKHSEQRLTLWTDRDAYFFKENESRALFSQIAHIITLSYDWDSGSFLQRWHHAAGDFIACCEDNTLDVRLITVRAIQPFPFLVGDDTRTRLSSLLLFLVDLTLRMRLDKLDGVGKTVWLDDFVVEETIRGFFSGLQKHRAKMGDEAYQTFLHLLPHFSAEELSQLSTPLYPFYEEQLSVSDLTEVKNNFARHIKYFAACLSDQVSNRRENPPSSNHPDPSLSR